MESKIRPITRDLICQVLDEIDLRYLRDKDGDFILAFRDEGNLGMSHMVSVALQGHREEVLALAVFFSQPPSLPRQEVLEKLNQWNAERRWPRAFIKDQHIFLDFHLDLEAGVHRELFRDTLLCFLRGVALFHLWWEGREGKDPMENLLRTILRRLRES
ncbi:MULTISPECIES: YbjN domain-containing protein [unclassified Meiothermus]|uniref:YbjN domain-containing protein n=1 Tax=unclassified Meiothermus TaxID=370471 RepID=UPI000D7BE278|nr:MULTISPECIES: YbjN domain-containing protein [unclassified Meiothermus]PZA06067.1 YbjN domain-containing protein [Meiothermus sp. Pnk-1]RYM31407.1 YbjN domain-containing protein [Meiothermus sp. PNK-Is4]